MGCEKKKTLKRTPSGIKAARMKQQLRKKVFFMGFPFFPNKKPALLAGAKHLTEEAPWDDDFSKLY
ncbi:MAG: hypothetical protein IJK97_10055 [Thermoguttaceae bacterium]|nr:hypothetical protein [Thermoguttaceae bacterium]